MNTSVTVYSLYLISYFFRQISVPTIFPSHRLKVILSRCSAKLISPYLPCPKRFFRLCRLRQGSILVVMKINLASNNWLVKFWAGFLPPWKVRACRWSLWILHGGIYCDPLSCWRCSGADFHRVFITAASFERDTIKY